MVVDAAHSLFDGLCHLFSKLLFKLLSLLLQRVRHNVGDGRCHLLRLLGHGGLDSLTLVTDQLVKCLDLRAGGRRRAAVAG